MKHHRERLTIVCENYWPEHASTGQLMTQLAEGLVDSHDVEVITSQPRYHGDYGRHPGGEVRNGVQIRRLTATRFDKKRKLGRIANWLSFGAMAALAIARRWERRTYLIVTNPPTAPWCALLTRLQGQPTFVLVHDLYPDLAQALNVVGRRSLPARLFDRLNVVSFRRSTAVIALARDMQARLQSKLGDATPVAVIPNWADARHITPTPKRESRFAREHDLAGKTVFLYAGNLGLFQDLETLVHAIETLPDGDSCRLVFVGDGGKRRVIEAAAKRSQRVLLFDYLPFEAVGDLYAAADVGLIALEPAVEMVNMPSKTYSILASGRPFIAVAGANHDLQELAHAGAGITVPNDPAAVADAMSKLHAHPRIRQRMGRAARQLFEQRYTLDHALGRFQALFATAMEAEVAFVQDKKEVVLEELATEEAA